MFRLPRFSRKLVRPGRAALLAIPLLVMVSSATAETTVDCSGLYPWNAETAYGGGSRVHHQTVRYEANWWTKGQNPLTHSGPWQEWVKQGQCAGMPKASNCGQLPKWNGDSIYLGGDEVKHNGKHYRAEWWTQGVNPEKADSWDAWVLLDKCAASLEEDDAPGGILWIASSTGVSKLVGGQVEQHFPGPASALAVAPGYVWVYHQRQLRGYRADGTLEAEVTLRQLHRRRVPAGLAADSDGLWLADDHYLYRLGRQGQLLKTVELNQRVTGMVQDKEGQLWLTASNQLLIISGDGQVLEQLPMPASVKSLAYDKERNHVWLSAGPDLLRIDAQTHAVELSFRLGPQTHLAAGLSGLWAAHANKLRLLNQAGEIIDTTKVQPPVQGIAVDLETGGIWVAGRNYLHFYNVGGELQYTHEISGAITHIASGDVPPPELVFLAPTDGAYINTPNPAVELEYHSKGTIDTDSITLTRENTALELDCAADETTANCTVLTELPESQVTLTATIADTNSQVSEPVTVTFTVDTLAPVVSLTSPTNGLVTNQPVLTLNGTVSELLQRLSLNIGGTSIDLSLDESHTFSYNVTLQDGSNGIAITAFDLAGNTGGLNLELVLDTIPPTTPELGKISALPSDENGRITITGQSGSVESGSRIILTNTRTGASTTIAADASGAFSATLTGETGDSVTITITDAAGNISDSAVVQVKSDLPPDPVSVAPPLTTTGITPYSEAVSFLYSGSNPVQTGIEPGTIEERRVAVIRGQVLDKQNNPLPGVTITIKDRPELGYTQTRTDGMFDMAVNGGDRLTLNYKKDGFLATQRQIDIQWNEFGLVDDVVLIPLDEQVTPIALDSAFMQVAQGSVSVDADGERRATILFPPGTTATMTLPDGTIQRLTQMDVRATEYTVGETGPQAMPGILPPSSGYTYAVELSADEAIDAGAIRVDFNEPLPVYVDNFLNFPVGGIVPSGWYDYDRTAWIPSDNGRVIAILAVEHGMAVLDVKGSGEPATDEALMELGITQEELKQLAELYESGQSFWRIPVSHFTPWDYNWPYGPPDGAEPPGQPEPEVDELEEKPDCEGGSIIECQSGVLRERISIVGTPFSLNYRSDQVPGRKAYADIQLSGDSIPPNLKEIQLKVQIAGQVYSYSFPAEPNLRHRFTWDGKDAYGREVVGSRRADIRIGYMYRGVFYSPSQFGRAFGSAGTRAITGIRTRQMVGIWQISQENLQVTSPNKDEFGAWSLSPNRLLKFPCMGTGFGKIAGR